MRFALCGAYFYFASQAAYPVHEERTVRLKNGATVLIRTARASDAGALQAQFHRLTPDRRHPPGIRRANAPAGRTGRRAPVYGPEFQERAPRRQSRAAVRIH
jgi:hypothetical protein